MIMTRRLKVYRQNFKRGPIYVYLIYWAEFREPLTGRRVLVNVFDKEERWVICEEVFFVEENFDINRTDRELLKLDKELEKRARKKAKEMEIVISHYGF